MRKVDLMQLGYIPSWGKDQDGTKVCFATLVAHAVGARIDAGERIAACQRRAAQFSDDTTLASEMRPIWICVTTWTCPEQVTWVLSG